MLLAQRRQAHHQSSQRVQVHVSEFVGFQISKFISKFKNVDFMRVAKEQFVNL